MVSVVRKKSTGEVYAMKTLHKQYILKRKEQAFYMEERDILALGESSIWIPKLHTAFQDHENLYLVMEYAPGGDLFSLLAKRDEPILDEEAARFYIAEIILAVADLHVMGYVHRDIKPNNILIDRAGHIKLADFGSCIKLGPLNKVTSSISVGTCDYISPEVLQAQEGNRDGYGQECDWWSIGIVLYEILQGDPPFYSESVPETYSKIMRHQEELQFLDEIPISAVAQDLIRSLLCGKDTRLGKNGVEEIKNHPFFNDFEWDNIRLRTPPFIPALESAHDTANFLPLEDVPKPVAAVNANRDSLGNHFPFIGFTFHSEVMQRSDISNSNSSSVVTSPNKAIEENPLYDENLELKQIIESGRISFHELQEENVRLKLQLHNLKTEFEDFTKSKLEAIEVIPVIPSTPQFEQEHLQNEIVLLKSSLEQTSCQVEELQCERELLLTSKKNLEIQVEEIKLEKETFKRGLDELRKTIVEGEYLTLAVEAEKHKVSQLEMKNQMLENNLRKYKDPRYNSIQFKSDLNIKFEQLMSEKIEIHKHLIQTHHALTQTQERNRKLEEKIEVIQKRRKEERSTTKTSEEYSNQHNQESSETSREPLEDTIKTLMKNNKELNKQLDRRSAEKEATRRELNELRQELLKLKKDKLSIEQTSDHHKCTREEILKLKITESVLESSKVDLERKMSQLVEENAYVRRKLVQTQKELEQRTFRATDLERRLLHVQLDKGQTPEKWTIKGPRPPPVPDKDYRRYSSSEKTNSLQSSRKKYDRKGENCKVS
ncbi:Serine/threonine-protein kinase MRCK gamma, variant 2 [Basidiobolus ranarum]|uniref:non-specific serine/threonine protein kinase n=1 Tax=Basidiobolus ranarum TaxID=34480 RepID=A0ABR2W6E4_9FUNG